MTNHILLVFRKDTIYFPSPNPPNVFSYAYYPGPCPGPIPGGYPGTIPPYPTYSSQNQNQNDTTDPETGAGTINETFHLLNERGLPVSPTSPILSTQTQTQTHAQAETQGKNAIAPLLLVAVTEAMRANESFFSGFEYLTSWMANDYRHYYVILKKKTQSVRDTTNSDNGNDRDTKDKDKDKDKDKNKNGDIWAASSSSPINNTKDTRDKDRDTKNKGNTASNDKGNEWGSIANEGNTNTTTTKNTTNDNEWGTYNESATTNNAWDTTTANDTTNTNEWVKPSSPPINPNPVSVSSLMNAKDSNNTWDWPNPPEASNNNPSGSSARPRPFTVRDWARSPSPAGNENDNIENTGTSEGTSGSVWGDTTPSSLW